MLPASWGTVTTGGGGAKAGEPEPRCLAGWLLTLLSSPLPSPSIPLPVLV